MQELPALFSVRLAATRVHTYPATIVGSVRTEEFWRDQESFGGKSLNQVLKLDLLADLRRGPIPDHSDLEAAIALARLLHDQYELYGTSGDQIMTDGGSRDATRTLLSIVRRLSISTFDPPFSDFPSFRTYWNGNGAHGSWQARREILQSTFGPLHVELEQREDAALRGELAEPISSAGATGWPRVDEEITELRRHFHAALTVQDYRNVGNDCVVILEALSAVVYDPQIHLRSGEELPPIGNTKQRLDRFIDDSAGGAPNEELRAFAKKSIVLAQSVKHNPTSSRRMAGIAADAVIQLSNMLRRLQEPEELNPAD